MKAKFCRSAALVSGVLLAGALATGPVLAQSDAGSNGQQAEEMIKKGKGAAAEGKGKGKGESSNRDNENRKADPASKGSEKGQQQKQEKSKAWWNFWD